MISDFIKKDFLKYKSPSNILSFKGIELKDIPDDLIEQSILIYLLVQMSYYLGF